MRILNTSTPIVILKSVAHGGLGLVRSLGRQGVDVYTVEDDSCVPAIYSRYSRGWVKLDVETASASEALRRLEALARKLGTAPVLVPCTDYAAIFMADHYERLHRRFIFPEQSPQLLRQLYNKREMHFLAKQNGVATADTLFPSTRQGVLSFLEELKFPIVLKAIDGTRLSARCGKKMFIVNSADELLNIYDSVEEPESPNLMLQEYIAGEDDSIWMFNGYFNKNSECLVAFTGKKLRQCPAFGGYACLGVCMDNQVVKETAIRFLRSLRYSGLVDIDFRYDARTQEYKMLDVNPRMGASFPLFTAANGIDLARAYYLDMTGQRVPPSSVTNGRKWIVGDLDFVSSLRYFTTGRLKLKAWLRSLRDIEDSAYFATDDLLPFLYRLTVDAIELHKRAFKKVACTFEKSTTKPDAAFTDSIPASTQAEA
ncbi:MAG TPA: hypothetical protein VG498_18065 [Terriglobales bacterium]|nr:hypothetical protein [Terriglobales bacterium]